VFVRYNASNLCREGLICRNIIVMINPIIKMATNMYMLPIKPQNCCPFERETPRPTNRWSSDDPELQGQQLWHVADPSPASSALSAHVM
jgi:hypothetical protein